VTIVLAQNYMLNSTKISERYMNLSGSINALFVLLLIVVIVVKPAGAMVI